MQNYARLNRFQYFADILILIGLVIVCGTAFGMIGKMAGANIFSMSYREFLSFMADTSWFEKIENLKLYNVFSTFGTWIVSGFLLFRIRKYRITDFWRFQGPEIKRTWLLLPFLFISSLFLASLLLYLNQNLDIPQNLKTAFGSNMSRKLLSRMLEMHSIKELLINLVVIAMVPAIFEEIFFRGTLQPLLIGFTGNTHSGISICSLIFAAIHLNMMQIIPMFFLSLVLGYLFHYTRSLFPGVIMHFCNNALAVISYYYRETSDIAKNVADDLYVPGIWEIILFTVLLASIFFYFHKQSRLKIINE